MEEELKDQEEDIQIRIFSSVQSYFNCTPRFNGVFSRNNLLRKEDRVYVINLDDKKVKKHAGFHYLLTEIKIHT